MKVEQPFACCDKVYSNIICLNMSAVCVSELCHVSLPFSKLSVFGREAAPSGATMPPVCVCVRTHLNNSC